MEITEMFLVKVCVITAALFVNAVHCRIDFGWLNAVIYKTTKQKFSVYMREFQTEQIRHFGYPLEIHEVVTDDGYILELHRIPHGLKDEGETNNSSSGKPVVFIMHGTLCTSGAFTSNYRDKSLAFVLADKGYDVWLGNQRGTPFSLRHAYLDEKNDKDKYWNFTQVFLLKTKKNDFSCFNSVTQFGVGDLSACIDYVLNETGKSNLHYIGHSQGNIGLYILLAEKPAYNDKVQVISLGPISFFKHFPNIIGRILLRASDSFQVRYHSVQNIFYKHRLILVTFENSGYL